MSSHIDECPGDDYCGGSCTHSGVAGSVQRPRCPDRRCGAAFDESHTPGCGSRIYFHRILITGSRDWEDRAAVYEAIDQRIVEYGRVTVVHGDCPTGADLHARERAQDHIRAGMLPDGEAYVRHEAYPALWDEFGKSAGPIRNRYMVELGADECVAFPLPASRGTISCMKLAQAAGILVTNLGTLPEGVLFR